MAWSGSPNAIAPGSDMQYNHSMRTRLQGFFDVLSRELMALETRWAVLIVTVILMLGFRAIGAAGAADLVGMIYIMYFVTFWRGS